MAIISGTANAKSMPTAVKAFAFPNFATDLNLEDLVNAVFTAPFALLYPVTFFTPFQSFPRFVSGFKAPLVFATCSFWLASAIAFSISFILSA